MANLDALLGTLRVDLKTNTSQLLSGFQRVEKETNKLNRTFNALRTVMLSVGAGFGVGEFVRNIVRVTNEFNTMSNSLEAATGSTQAAAREMRFITGEADRLGLSLIGAAKEYGTLAASAKGTALEGEGVRKIFTGVSEAFTALGLGSEGLSLALRGLRQAISKGKVSAEDFNQQVAEHIPGGIKRMADALGVGREEFFKLQAAGKVGIETLVKFGEELSKEYGDAATKASKQLRAEMQRLTTATDRLLLSLGKLAGPTMIIVVKQIAKFLDSVRKFIDGSKEMNVVLKAIRGTIAVFGLFLRDLAATVNLLWEALTTDPRKIPEIWKRYTDVVKENWRAYDDLTRTMWGYKDAMDSVAPTVITITKSSNELTEAQKKAANAWKDALEVSHDLDYWVRQAGDAVDEQAASLDKVTTSATSATGAVSALNSVLGAFGLSLPGGAGVGVVANLQQVVASLQNPSVLGPAAAGIGGGLIGGNTGGIAGAAGGAFLATSMLSGAMMSATMAAVLPIALPIAFGVIGGFAGNKIFDELFGDESQPSITFGTFDQGTRGGSGRFGQNSFISQGPLGDVMVGGRDGGRLTEDMMDFARGLVAADEIVADLLDPSQLERAARAAKTVANETRSENFDPKLNLFLREEAIFDAIGGDLDKLFDSFDLGAESIENFLAVLETLTEMGESALDIARNLDTTADTFPAMIAMLVAFEEFGSSTLSDVRADLDALNATPMQIFADARTALGDVMTAFDGSERSISEMAVAMGNFQAATVAALQAIRAARASIDSTISGALRSVSSVGMTPEEIYARNANEANAILRRLQSGTITDPGEIARLTGQATSLTTSGFGGLSDSQQLSKKEDVTRFLEGVQEITTHQLDSIEDTLEQAFNEAAETMESSIDRAAQALVKAADVSEKAISRGAARLQQPPDVNVVVPGQGELNA